MSRDRDFGAPIQKVYVKQNFIVLRRALSRTSERPLGQLRRQRSQVRILSGAPFPSNSGLHTSIDTDFLTADGGCIPDQEGGLAGGFSAHVASRHGQGVTSLTVAGFGPRSIKLLRCRAVRLLGL
ncbi:hypothetical protein RHIZ404_220372 [Rhizobium sp. EC-SD404]|nr:hypothetical protein RHIZ404_220372 [Rhizobium sp. EC-SD404]